MTHPPHSRCFACGPENAAGLRLVFDVLPDRSVAGRFRPLAALDGYPQTLHSGVVAALLDSAMANCMFAQGHPAYASELTVRYLAPVLTEHDLVLKARFIRGRFPACVLEARLLQQGQCRASAKGIYTKQPGVAVRLKRGRTTAARAGPDGAPSHEQTA